MNESPVVIDEAEAKVIGRKVGWVVAAIITGALLWFVNLLPDWDRTVSWLTDDFVDALPSIRNALIASIVVYLLYVIYDADWFRALGDLVSGWFSLVAGWTIWQVFPFDFSAYDFDWALLARFVIGLGLFGTAVAMIANLVKLGRALARSSVDAAQVR
jgi:hypothetical protein